MIGIFDSGLGGLTVVKELFKYLPEYKIVYFGDSARLPYGTKGPDFVKKYSLKISEFLFKQGAKIIIIACHTATSWAEDYLKRSISIPVFGIINPSLDKVISTTKNKRIGIIGTPGTIKSKNWEKKLLSKDSKLKIYTQSCPLFVPLVEEGWERKKIAKEIIREYLSPLKQKKIDTLVMACTHYPLLEKQIKEFLGKEIFMINPSRELVFELRRFLKNNHQIEKKLTKSNNHIFFFSDIPYNLEKISNHYFKRKINPVIKKLFI